MKLNFFFFFIFLIVITFNFFLKKINEDFFIEEPVLLTVDKGMNLKQVSNILIKNKIFTNDFYFISWVKLNFASKKIKAGEYLIKKKFSIESVTETLILGKTLIHLFQLSEGDSKKQFYKKLSNIRQDFQSTEVPSNLIANTYGYTIHDDFSDILNIIKNQSFFESKKIWDSRNKLIPLESINELFILASIIEKETGKNSEKSIIAGVFYNRLIKKMKLQSDPTVIYSITLGDKFDRKLSRKDLKLKSEYNTYHIKGLPPTPICYPSYETLLATANPVYSDYLYFVADGKGGHLFSKSYKEHLKNIENLKKNDN